MKNTEFLGIHLAENLSWSLNTNSTAKKTQQRLYFLRQLKKAHLYTNTLTTFYRGTVENIGCINVWPGNCTISAHKTLERIVRTVREWLGSLCPPPQTFTQYAASLKPTALCQTPHTPHIHSSPSYYLEKRYHSISAHTVRICNSFFLNKATHTDLSLYHQHYAD